MQSIVALRWVIAVGKHKCDYHEAEVCLPIAMISTNCEVHLVEKENFVFV